MFVNLKYLPLVAGMLLVAPAFAQQSKTGNPNQQIKQFKPPKLISVIGIRSDTVTVVLQEAVQLINLPLKVTDDNKNVYSISTYNFVYKRRAVTEDEKTGKVTPVTSIASDLFRKTPLPELWKKIIAEQLKTGEELVFYDIIVKDAAGRYMYAPPIYIKVK